MCEIPSMAPRYSPALPNGPWRGADSKDGGGRRRHGSFGRPRSTLQVPRIFRAPAATLVSFSAIQYAGPVAVGPGQGPRHDCDHLPPAAPRRPAALLFPLLFPFLFPFLLPFVSRFLRSPPVAGSRRFRTGSPGRRLVAAVPRSRGGTPRTDGGARSVVGADHQGHRESRPLAGRPAQGARRRACGEGGLVPGRAGPARADAALVPRGPLEPAGGPAADASGLGRLADGRRERPTGHVDREPVDGGGRASADGGGDRPGRGGGLGLRRRT